LKNVLEASPWKAIVDTFFGALVQTRTDILAIYTHHFKLVFDDYLFLMAYLRSITIHTPLSSEPESRGRDLPVTNTLVAPSLDSRSILLSQDCRVIMGLRNTLPGDQICVFSTELYHLFYENKIVMGDRYGLVEDGEPVSESIIAKRRATILD
jgi:hypothetical protein